MPPLLTVLSGVECPGKRFGIGKLSVGKRLSRSLGRGKCRKVGRRKVCKTKRGKGYVRIDTNRRKHTSRGRFSVGGLFGARYFHCPTKGVKGKTKKRHVSINKLMKRLHVKRLKFKPIVKGKGYFKRRKTLHKKLYHSGLPLLVPPRFKLKRMAYGRKLSKRTFSLKGLFGVNTMRKRKKYGKKRVSLGRTLARRLKVGKKRCKQYGRRKVCKTAKGKGYIRIDKKGRKHRRSGSGKLSLNGLFGMGKFSGDSCSHRVIRAGYRGFGISRRSGYRRSRSLGFLGALPGAATARSFLPPISKDNVMRWGAGLSGILLPMTVQNMLVPAKWRIGWRGLLTYTAIGGAYIVGAGKIKMLQNKKQDIAFGWGIGFLMKTFQDYIFKRTLVPAQNVNASTALKGLCDACTSCANAGDCGEEGVGACIGYISEDEVGDYDNMGWMDGIDDEYLDGINAYYGGANESWQGSPTGYSSRRSRIGDELDDDDLDGFDDDDLDGFDDDDLGITKSGVRSRGEGRGARKGAVAAGGTRQMYNKAMAAAGAKGVSQMSEAQARQLATKYLARLSPAEREAAKADLRARYARGERLSQYTRQQVQNWAKQYTDKELSGVGDYLVIDDDDLDDDMDGIGYIRKPGGGAGRGSDWTAKNEREWQAYKSRAL